MPRSGAAGSGITAHFETTVRCSGWEGNPVKHEPEDLPGPINIHGFRVKSEEWAGQYIKAAPSRQFSKPAKKLTEKNEQEACCPFDAAGVRPGGMGTRSRRYVTPPAGSGSCHRNQISGKTKPNGKSRHRRHAPGAGKSRGQTPGRSIERAGRYHGLRRAQR